MLHAKIPDGFYDFGNTGLDPKACELILTKLDDDICGRFLSYPIVGYEFSETTAAHEVRTFETLDGIYKKVIKDKTLLDNKSCHIKAMIMTHDISDIIKEVIIATTETDPKLKKDFSARLKHYDNVTTSFVYHLGLFAVREKNDAIFNETIDELRTQTIKPHQHTCALTLQEAADFCINAVKVIEEKSKQLAQYCTWNDLNDHQHTDNMMSYFHEIENASTFSGMQAKIHEKCDGTDYACEISKRKNYSGLTPTYYHERGITLHRINERFEKNLSTLFDKAGKIPLLQTLACKTIQHCYGVSKKVMGFAKPYLSMRDIAGEPGLSDCDDLHTNFVLQHHKDFENGQLDTNMASRDAMFGFYEEAIDDITRKGILILPEPGKTLVQSPNFTTIELSSSVRDALNY